MCPTPHTDMRIYLHPYGMADRHFETAPHSYSNYSKSTQPYLGADIVL